MKINKINQDLCSELSTYCINYIEKLKYEDKSINTINSYKNTINSFIEYILSTETQITMKNLKPSIIYSFFNYKELSMNKQGQLATNTKILLLTHLKTFFKYIELESDELLDFTKLFASIKLKSKKSEPKGISRDDEIKILNLLEDDKTNKKDYVSFRNALIVKTILYSGLRVSEMLSLKYKDYIFPEEGKKSCQITVTGKGDKKRTVYLNSECITDDYDELVKLNSLNDYVCLSKNKKLISRVYIDKLVKSLSSRVGIASFSVHELRHTFAKRYLENNGSIVHLQGLLGHSDIKTTMIYANPHQGDIRDGFEKTLL